MKTLIILISKAIKKWRYYWMCKEISTMVSILFILWFLRFYGASVGHWAVSETGLIYIIFLLAALILGLALKMFYRMMAIKYYEKSIDIELFKFINKENN